jgi:transposase
MKSEVLPRLNAEDKRLTENILSAGNIKHKFAVRLQTVSRRANGEAANNIARFLGIHTNTVSCYVRRYNDGGIGALVRDKTRKPGKAPISVELKNEICRLACTVKPENATRWSTRSLAKRFKVSHGTVSQIQALERTAPVLPMLPHVPERQTVDYERHGTTTLFAALGMLTGNVTGERGDRHRASDYIAFLKKLDRGCEKGKVLHIIADNYATHKTPEVKAYIKSKGGRFETHFIPTHSSRLNMIERWFAEITNKRIRRESWESAGQLKKAIKDFISGWNKSGRGFKWTKKPDEILAKIRKARTETALPNE